MQQNLLEQDVARLAEQERLLRFEHFDPETAFELGCRVRELCRSRGLALAIEVRMARTCIFWSSMPGTSDMNEDWVRRKRNTVELFGQSSYLVARMLELESSSLESKMGLATREFAAFGGGFPITVNRVGCIGSVTVSGASQRQDHALVVEALADMCGVPLSDIALDEE